MALSQLGANDCINLRYSRLKVATLPSKGTRHNTWMFSHAMSDIVISSLWKYKRRNIVVIGSLDQEDVQA